MGELVNPSAGPALHVTSHRQVQLTVAKAAKLLGFDNQEATRRFPPVELLRAGRSRTERGRGLGADGWGHWTDLLGGDFGGVPSPWHARFWFSHDMFRKWKERCFGLIR